MLLVEFLVEVVDDCCDELEVITSNKRSAKHLSKFFSEHTGFLKHLCLLSNFVINLLGLLLLIRLTDNGNQEVEGNDQHVVNIERPDQPNDRYISERLVVD